jgi:hypothetical protein
MAGLPIACTLSPEALKARRDNLLGALLRRSTEHTVSSRDVRKVLINVVVFVVAAFLEIAGCFASGRRSPTWPRGSP